jgi:hypothetical protein
MALTYATTGPRSPNANACSLVRTGRRRRHRDADAGQGSAKPATLYPAEGGVHDARRPAPHQVLLARLPSHAHRLYDRGGDRREPRSVWRIRIHHTCVIAGRGDRHPRRDPFPLLRLLRRRNAGFRPTFTRQGGGGGMPATSHLAQASTRISSSPSARVGPTPRSPASAKQGCGDSGFGWVSRGSASCEKDAPSHRRSTRGWGLVGAIRSTPSDVEGRVRDIRLGEASGSS